MARTVRLDGLWTGVFEVCLDLTTYASLRGVSQEVLAQMPPFSMLYIVTGKICYRLWEFCSPCRPFPVAEVDHARAWVLALRVLLRWSEPSDGCASLIGQHMSALDSELMRSRSVALRAEGSELLREVGEHVASVRILLAKRHAVALVHFRWLSTLQSSSWEPSDHYHEYVRDCLKMERAEAGKEIWQAVAWADYAISAFDVHWTGASDLPRPDEEPLGWINVRVSCVGRFSVSVGLVSLVLSPCIPTSAVCLF